MGWIKDIVSPQTRQWEEFYRNRFQHDRIVRSTHGVNCTGGCSWQIHVKDGIVTWETQQLDYPLLEDSLPPYEPRGCQRGISYSWYLYSPLRIKYPLIRSALVAFLEDTQARSAQMQPRDYGIGLFVSGVVGTIFLLGLYSLLWGGRKRESVNQAIFDRQVKSI